MYKKIVFFGFISIIMLFFLIPYQWFRFRDGKLHVIFCNVGQGDAIFIRTPNGSDIIVDGGPNDAILSCLSKHMPFWDRTIELVMLTHPHFDHFNGLVSVFNRYTVISFVTEKIENDTKSFASLLSAVQKEKIKPRYVFAGSTMHTNDGVTIRIVGPTNSFVAKTSPQGKIGESKEFGSLETLVSYGSFDGLLTGDSQAEELVEAVGMIPSKIEVLQIPHHGSKTGLDEQILGGLDPKLAVISVGKNKYGHPSSRILELLKTYGVKVLRTDLPAGRQVSNGDIEVISNGKTWYVRQ